MRQSYSHFTEKETEAKRCDLPEAVFTSQPARLTPEPKPCSSCVPVQSFSRVRLFVTPCCPFSGKPLGGDSHSSAGVAGVAAPPPPPQQSAKGHSSENSLSGKGEHFMLECNPEIPAFPGEEN